MCLLYVLLGLTLMNQMRPRSGDVSLCVADAVSVVGGEGWG